MVVSAWGGFIAAVVELELGRMRRGGEGEEEKVVVVVVVGVGG